MDVLFSECIKDLILNGKIELDTDFAVAFTINNYGRIEGCTNKTEVRGISFAAGIVGINYDSGVIVNCCNEGYIYAETNQGWAAGIAEYSSGVVYACYNKGTIEGYNAAGIFSMQGNSGNLGVHENCYNVGTIKADYVACGNMIYSSGTEHYMYNIGKIEGKGYSIGIGEDIGGVTNCYTLGKGGLIHINISGRDSDSVGWIEDLA